GRRIGVEVDVLDGAAHAGALGVGGQFSQALLEEIRVDLGVTVDADYDISGRGSDAEVHRVRNGAARVVQYYDPAFGALHFGDHRPCVVIAHAINHDDLERLDSLTRRQQGLDSASDELPLVADGHDDADLGRVRHQEPPVASDSPAPTEPC